MDASSHSRDPKLRDEVGPRPISHARTRGHAFAVIVRAVTIAAAVVRAISIAAIAGAFRGEVGTGSRAVGARAGEPAAAGVG